MLGMCLPEDVNLRGIKIVSMRTGFSLPEELSITSRQIVGQSLHPRGILGSLRQIQKFVNTAYRAFEIRDQIFIAQDVHSISRLLQMPEIVYTFEETAKGICRARVKGRVAGEPLKKMIHLLRGHVVDPFKGKAANLFGQARHVARQVIQIGQKNIQRVAINIDDLIGPETTRTFLDKGRLVV